MSALSSFLIRRVGKAAAARFEEATKDPVGVQHRKLLQIIERNRETEYGKAHSFSGIKSFKAYREKVPVITYEDIKDDMKRVVAGAKMVFTAEDPALFAQTSGTTGDAKYIPVTPTCQGRDHSDQMRTWIHHAAKDHRRLFDGKIFSLVSPAIEGYTESGIPFGSTSGHIYKHMPGPVRSTYAIPYDVFEIEDYEAKYYVLMRLGIASNVTFLSTANPSSIIKLCELANENSEHLLKDLADGTLRQDINLEPEIRTVIERSLKANAKKATQLDKARNRRAGMLLPADYWPNLSLIGCWKGGTVGSYVDKFPGWFDPEGRGMTPVRDWGYLSSEARGSIPLTDEGSGGVLTVATNIYEFVSVEELELNPDARDKWNFLGVDEVEVGKEYYIFFTTTAGLYRYDINDVVEIVGFYNKTPVLIFRRKGRGMTSITGEKVSVNQVIDAFDKASKEHAITLDHFKAEADLEHARYVFKIEVAGGIPEEKRRPMLKTLDNTLSGLNLEYEAKRKSLRLNDPVLHVMKNGWYDNQKKKLIAEGKRVFQAKTVILSMNPLLKKEDDLEAVVTWQDS